MRVLLLTSDPERASQLGRRLAADHEVRAAGSLAEALLDLVQPLDRPDLIVTDLDLPDAQGYSMLKSLQEAALGIPILICEPLESALTLKMESLARLTMASARQEQVSDTVVFEQHRVRQVAALRDAEWQLAVADACQRAAQLAAEKAVRETLERFGSADPEALRLALQLARSFESLKARFLAAVATGLAGALLVALGAGIVALLRRHLSE